MVKNKKEVSRLLFIAAFLLPMLLGFAILFDSNSKAKESNSEKILLKIKYNGDPIIVRLLRVYDGDTIKVDLYGRKEKIRIVGIDTPERDEKFYIESSAFTRYFLRGQPITIEICTAQRRDKYGRLLAWVYAGGVSLEKELLKAGLARTLSIPPCGLRFENEYKKIETIAKEQNLGQWMR